MQEAVSSILIGRSREADGLNRMMVVSLVIHGVLMTALVLLPRDWLRVQPEEQATPMMISLGPSGTADTGGMTAITSRPVQEETPEAKPMPAPPGGEDAGDGGAGAGGEAQAVAEAGREADREVVDAQAIDRRGSKERRGARRDAERRAVPFGGWPSVPAPAAPAGRGSTSPTSAVLNTSRR